MVSLLKLYSSKDALRLLGLRHTWMLELSSTTGNGGPLQSPRRPPARGVTSVGELLITALPSVIFPELVSFVEGVE